MAGIEEHLVREVVVAVVGVVGGNDAPALVRLVVVHRVLVPCRLVIVDMCHEHALAR